MIVLDTSVIAKWLLLEPDTPRAKQLLRHKLTFAAPELLDFEVKSALSRAYRQDRLTAAETKILLHEWQFAMRDLFHWTSFAVLEDDAIRLALQIKHAFYDCFYLALAQSHNIPLITADTVFHNRARQVYDNVHLLDAYVVD